MTEDPQEEQEELFRLEGRTSLRGSTDLRRIELGGSPTECQFRRESWSMNKARFLELIRLMTHLSSSCVPHRLTDADIEAVQGECFRGTQLFLALLPLYSDGSFFFVNDNSVYRRGSAIEMRSFLVYPFGKEMTLNYANKYLDPNGIISREGFLGVEGRIFQRVLKDNGADLVKVPDWLIQPVVLGFNKQPHENPIVARLCERVLDGARPSISTLAHIADISGVKLNTFKEDYPLLSSSFQD